MRWWLRILVSLILAPILWQLAGIYLGTTQGGTPDAMVAAAYRTLPKLYLVYTLPAVALLLLLLLADRLLALAGLDLLIVAVAPLLAVLVLLVASRFIADPRLDALYYLAFAYGLVFGLTVREPPRAVPVIRGSP